MEVRRLAWAGLEVSAGGESAVVDFVEDFGWMPGDPPPGRSRRPRRQDRPAPAS